MLGPPGPSGTHTETVRQLAASASVCYTTYMTITSLRRPDRRFDPLCHVCDKATAPVIFCCTAHRRDDMHLSCDVCLDPVCAACADELEDGTVVCASCSADEALRERLAREATP